MAVNFMISGFGEGRRASAQMTSYCEINWPFIGDYSKLALPVMFIPSPQEGVTCIEYFNDSSIRGRELGILC